MRKQATVEEGSIVQWVSQGVHQFKTPHRVRQVINDPEYGKFVLVYGSNTGIPYNEVILWRENLDTEELADDL